MCSLLVADSATVPDAVADVNVSSQVANLEADVKDLAYGENGNQATQEELSQIENEIGREGELRAQGRAQDADDLDGEIRDQLQDLYTRLAPAITE